MILFYLLATSENVIVFMVPELGGWNGSGSVTSSSPSSDYYFSAHCAPLRVLAHSLYSNFISCITILTNFAQYDGSKALH